ncbi:MFS transporter [Cellulomonas sp. C5510]|uniref:MFS transporter n=1 Tax=Cellulomonas sp. C5510 TaxID=2871170 RepID=UPI001C96D73B|nr:MFS transporter [Cellulomonas sp. C5510]QZN86573.1 MFS transporter [Cellulomonas sp. C5510]
MNTTAVTPARASAAPTRSNYAWVILIACIGFYAVPVGIVGNTSGIFVTPVMEQFGWSRTEATLYMTIQPWVAALCTPVAGALMAKYNPRWILTLTAAAYGLSTIWTAYATHPWQWHLYGVIYGVSCSFFMFLAVPTLVNAWFRKQAGLAIGTAGAALSILAAVASPVGQSMIESQGWQHTRMVFGVVITVVSVALTALFVRKDPASMNVLPFGADDTGAAATTTGAPPAEEGAELAQARRIPAFYLLILTAGFLVFCAAFFQQIPSFAATGELGAEAGAVAVSIVMIGGTCGKFLLGWLSDALGSKVTGVVAGLCGAAGLAMALLAGSSVALFYVGMGVFGVGYSALTVISPMVAREGFGTAHYAEIYSWVSTGIFVFSGLAALTYARIYDMSGSFTPAFVLVICLYLAVAVFVPVILRTARRGWAGRR